MCMSEPGEPWYAVNEYDNEMTIAYKYIFQDLGTVAAHEVDVLLKSGIITEDEVDDEINLKLDPVRLLVVRGQEEWEPEEDLGYYVAGGIVYQTILQFLAQRAWAKMDPEDYRTVDEATVHEIYLDLQNYLKGVTTIVFGYYYYSFLASAVDVTKEDVTESITSRVNNFHFIADKNAIPENRRYDNFGSLHGYYSQWRRDETSVDVAKDYGRYNEIINSQRTMFDLHRAHVGRDKFPSDIHLTEVLASFNPKLREDGTMANADDGMDIFRDSTLSGRVTHVKYVNGRGIPYHKIYTGLKVEDAPNFTHSRVSEDSTTRPDTLYLRIRTTEKLTAPSTMQSYTTAVYRLKESTLVVSTPLDCTLSELDEKAKESISIAAARETLPSLEIGDSVSVSRIRGDFYVVGFSYEAPTLLHLVLNDPLMRTYLFNDERDSAQFDKERLTLHYGLPSFMGEDTEYGTGRTQKEMQTSSISVTLGNRYGAYPSEIGVEGSGQYIRVKIAKARSSDTLITFRNIFFLLMIHYTQKSEAISKLYVNALGVARYRELHAMAEKERKTKKSRKPHGRGESYDDYPDIFNPNTYKRYIAQGDTAQPLVFKTIEEAKRYAIEIRDQLTTVNGQGRPYRDYDLEHFYMKFPLRWGDDSKGFIYISCSDKTMPFPGPKPNTTKNSSQHPWLPKCYRRPLLHTDNYGRFLAREIPLLRSGTKIGTTKSLRDRSEGPVLGIVGDQLTYLLRLQPSWAVRRFGVPDSPNSFMHCLCVALADVNTHTRMYASVGDDSREAFVRDLRTTMANAIHPELLKQELHDHDKEDIRRVLVDPEVFLDADIFYRAAEEFFGVNIYVFTGADTSEDAAVVRTPRYKTFHCRTLRENRYAILLMRAPGSHARHLKNPQHEVIFVQRPDRKEKSFLMEDVTRNFHNHIAEATSILSATYRPEGGGMEVHRNVYYSINYVDLLLGKGRELPERQLLSQYIDENGKCRAFTMKLVGTEITLIVPPCQPENLPHSRDYRRLGVNVVMEILGEPAYVSVTDDQVDGYWYKILDLDYGVYVPLIPYRHDERYNVGLGDPLKGDRARTGGEVERYSILRKTINVFTQLLVYIYEIYLIESVNRRVPPNEFFTRHVTVERNPPQDSARYYDTSLIPRKFLAPERLPMLPVEGNPDEQVAAKGENVKIAQRNRDAITVNAIIGLYQAREATKRSNFFSDGKLCMYNREFYDKMRTHIEQYGKNRIPYGPGGVNTPRTVPAFIRDYYETHGDFPAPLGSKVLIGDKDFSSWLMSTEKESIESQRILHRITKYESNVVDPILFKDERGKIFILQNVYGSSVRRAIRVCDTWNKTGVNIGYYAKAHEGELPPVKIYCITMSYGTDLGERKDGVGVPVTLLFWGTSGAHQQAGGVGRYSALLVIR